MEEDANLSTTIAKAILSARAVDQTALYCKIPPSVFARACRKHHLAKHPTIIDTLAAACFYAEKPKRPLLRSAPRRCEDRCARESLLHPFTGRHNMINSARIYTSSYAFRSIGDADDFRATTIRPFDHESCMHTNNLMRGCLRRFQTKIRPRKKASCKPMFVQIGCAEEGE